MATEQNPHFDVNVERRKALALLLEDAFQWHALAENAGNTLVGERFILVDAHERAFSQIIQNGERHNKLELVEPSLVGAMQMDSANAARAKAEMEKQLPECGPYVVWDYQEFAKHQSAKLMATAKTLDNVSNAVVAAADPHALVRERLTEMGFDAKFYDQIQSKLIDMRAKSLDDDELERVFAGTVSKDFNCKFAGAARESGLKITDVYGGQLGAQKKTADAGYVVLAIDNLEGAAFREPGRLLEVARIMKEAATHVDLQSAMTSADLRSIDFKVRDVNGNPVGSVRHSQMALTDGAPPGSVRVAISSESLGVGLAGPAVARVLQAAASKAAKGNDGFELHGDGGQVIGKFEFQPLPSPAQDGVIDMADALSSRKVFWAEEGYSGLAEGEFMFVVATPDYEPNYGDGAGPVWLVNAKGEIAPGYDEPQVIRETMFESLSKEQESSLRAVIEGALSIEEFNARFNPDEQDDTPGMP